jgi:tRNA(Ile)-lysidine synthase TilS/MesJ
MRRVRTALSQGLSKRIDKALLEYRMLQQGDRVLIGVSGGKDSATLLYHLGMKAGRFSVPFQAVAFHVQTELEPPQLGERLAELCDTVGVPLVIRRVHLGERLQSGRALTCYWCATQRRTELLQYAAEEGFHTIALGHHLEDHVETFLMNLTRRRELSAMLPVMSYRKYEQRVIRPLAWVRESETEAFAREIGFDAVQCGCGLDRGSTRKEARRVLEAIAAVEGDGVKERIFEALHHPRVRYLIRRSNGIGDSVGRGYQDALHDLPE